MKRVFIVFYKFSLGAQMRVFTNYTSARAFSDAIISHEKSVGWKITKLDRGNDINDYCKMERGEDKGFCNIIQKELED